MARPCSICGHPEHAAIDQDLVAGMSMRATGTKWSVSRSAITRHSESHIPRVLHQVVEHASAETARVMSLQDKVERLETRATSILDRAEQADDLRLALAAIGQLRSIIELGVEAAKTEELATRLAQLELRVQSNARAVLRPPREKAWG